MRLLLSLTPLDNARDRQGIRLDTFSFNDSNNYLIRGLNGLPYFGKLSTGERAKASRNYKLQCIERPFDAAPFGRSAQDIRCSLLTSVHEWPAMSKVYETLSFHKPHRMEAGGVEPPSRDISGHASTCLVVYVFFRLFIRQTTGG